MVIKSDQYSGSAERATGSQGSVLPKNDVDLDLFKKQEETPEGSQLPIPAEPITIPKIDEIVKPSISSTSANPISNTTSLVADTSDGYRELERIDRSNTGLRGIVNKLIGRIGERGKSNTAIAEDVGENENNDAANSIVDNALYETIVEPEHEFTAWNRGGFAENVDNTDQGSGEKYTKPFRTMDSDGVLNDDGLKTIYRLPTKGSPMPKNWLRKHQDRRYRNISEGERAIAAARNDAWKKDHPKENILQTTEYDAREYDLVSQSLLDKYKGKENVKDEETGEVIPYVPPGTNVTFKDNLSHDRAVEINKWDFMDIGFIHISGEKYDKKNKKVEFPFIVKEMTKYLCNIFGLDSEDIRDQKIVHQCVRLRAGMGYDRQGKMFNQNRDVYEMSADEFVRIGNDMIKWWRRAGNPFFIEAHDLDVALLRAEHKIYDRDTADKEQNNGVLNRTVMIPAFHIPRAIAHAICGEKSQIPMDEKMLMSSSRALGNMVIVPWMKKNLVPEPNRSPSYSERKKARAKKILEDEYDITKKDNVETVKHGNRVAQFVSVIDFNEALARLDGVDEYSFSLRYDIDTLPHYSRAEYEDPDRLYAQAMNGRFNADEVEEYRKRLYDQCDEKRRKHSNRDFSSVDVAMNMLAVVEKTNALFWQIPIVLSSIPEKGIGDIQTSLALKTIKWETERVTGMKIDLSDIPEGLSNAFKTTEAVEAIDAALVLLEVGGPEALFMFSELGSVPLNMNEVQSFLEDNFLPNMKSKNAAMWNEAAKKLSNIQRHIMTGDFAFRKKDSTNFLTALILGNYMTIGMQKQLEENGLIDKRMGQAYTVEELNDIFLESKGDVSIFISQMLGTASCRDALIMMRSNNIGNFNPVGHFVNTALRNSGVTNAMITTFVDTFATYGINWLYMIVPFSRTLSYMVVQNMKISGNLTSGMLIPGGEYLATDSLDKQTSFFYTLRENLNPLNERLAQDPEFMIEFNTGLRSNLIFDLYTCGRWGITALIIGLVMFLRHYDPPEDPNEKYNSSKYKIGGTEYNFAFWLNDLTQGGLPLAVALASTLSGNDKETTRNLFMDCLYDQIDGNVVLDIADYIKYWDKELEDLDMASEDPDYIPQNPSLMASFGDLLLGAVDKITPGSPMMAAAHRDSFIQSLFGNKYEKDPYKVQDYSEQWKIDAGVTKYVDDPLERLYRKHAANNWLLASLANFYHSVIKGEKDQFTGYMWSQMVDKTKPEYTAIAWAQTQELDYTDRGGCKDDWTYEEVKTDMLCNQIDEVIEKYGGIQQAAMNGYIISEPIRSVAKNHLLVRINQVKNEFNAMEENGMLSSNAAFYKAKADRDKLIDEFYYYYNILKDEDTIPKWIDGYEVLITDRDITYTWPDGSPATPFDFLFNGDVIASYDLKGNHPMAIAPITRVDTSSDNNVTRGFEGETVPSYYNENTYNPEATRELLKDVVIKNGKYAGKSFNELYFGDDGEGNMLHPDQPTLGERSLMPRKD